MRDWCKFFACNKIVNWQRNTDLFYILLSYQLIHSSMWTHLLTQSCFCGWFMDDLQTRKVSRSAISSEAFAIFPLWKFRAETFPCVLNSKLRNPPCLQHSSPETPFPSEFQGSARGRVWIFSGITHWKWVVVILFIQKQLFTSKAPSHVLCL